MKSIIQSVRAREILGASGRPTVEATVTLEAGISASASAPSGTSKGRHEAHDVRDGGSRFRGLGCRTAANNVTVEIGPALAGLDATDQALIDRRMVELDGTGNKGRLGANAILAVSSACAKAGAAARGLPVYEHLGVQKDAPKTMPMPMATVIAGGEYSSSSLDFEDYLYILDGFDSVSDAVEGLWEMRHVLEETLTERFGAVADVGGGLAPPLKSTREAFDLMLKVADKVGCARNVHLGLDVAASELFDASTGTYQVGGKPHSVDEMIAVYEGLAKDYPLVFIEDPFQQDDFDAHAKLTARLPDRLIVGDDLFVSNAARLSRGIEEKAANAILMKINQIGTLSEAAEAARLAAESGFGVTASLRSHDTTDDIIVDFAVAMGARLIKLGSPVRGERNAKYNRLLEIEQSR